MSENYIRFENLGKEAYVRKDALEQLKKVDAAIFDCDGVLLDIRESYNRTIVETVAYITEAITGFEFPKNLISKETIYLFKKSGGYNNDWDLAYAILMFLLHWLQKRVGNALVEILNTNVEPKNNLPTRFNSIKNTLMKGLSIKELENVFAGLEDALKSFAELADASGIGSIKNALKKSALTSDSQDLYKAAKSFLSYPGDVNESLLMRVFEEIFCGPYLFKEMYKVEPLFNHERGLVENERLILQSETLDHLALLFGKANFGISSGRQSKLAEYKLGRFLDKFRCGALVFLDEVQVAQFKALKKGKVGINLHKPNPFSLLKSSEGLEPFEFALYVGDSREDVIMVKEVNKVKTRFLFAGVYEYSDCKEDALRCFIEANSEVVVPSVNELPTVLRAVKQEVKHA
jgi:phosphoglycolate phosphatase-like HAD superfamily hydrolase